MESQDIYFCFKINFWCKLYKSVRESQEYKSIIYHGQWCKLYKSVRESQNALAICFICY